MPSAPHLPKAPVACGAAPARLAPLAAALALLAAGPALADAGFTVSLAPLPDEKAVFATVESTDMVPARVRTGGTVASLSVREGDAVAPGQVIATIGDQKLALQQEALDAQIAALKAQLEQARADLERGESLAKGGFTTRQRLDELRTAADVAASTLKARTAERAVLGQQLAEGQVLAPTAGRVLSVPVTQGTVVMSGEVVATIARQDLVLRLSVPERHASSLRAGAPVRLDREEPGVKDAGFGTVTLVYPRIADGRVQADAKVGGLGDYFVGQRVRVWIPAGERPAIVVPAGLLSTRFGMDYALLRRPDGGTREVPVQRGQPRPRPDLPDGVEILSGLIPGDVLVRP